jgi:hypothetical protein
MPHWTVRHHPDGVTPDEHHKLLQIRRQTLDDATRAEGSLFPMPVTWRWGWKAHIVIRGRDRDHSLMAEIRVTGPALERPYVRRVRLCRRHRLPSDLTLE